MQQLLAHMAGHDFHLSHIEADGKIHRFDRHGKQKNAWYIAWPGHSFKSGEHYLICQFGDWRDGSDYLYKPGHIKFSKEDNDLISRQLELKKKLFEEEKKKRQQDAADKAEKFLQKCKQEELSEYLQRKKIDQLYGSYTFLDAIGLITVVPIKDVSGRLWNYQRIFPDGTKKFAFGGLIDECFHVIGNIDSDVIICEGFATAASIHMATDIPVVCAFNSGNLPKVAIAIRKAYPDANIIIAGDDDRHTKGNPGRTSADKAANRSGGSVIFPDYENGTDFNDLHVGVSLQAVKECFQKPVTHENGFVPLGYYEKSYYFFSMIIKDIVEITSFSDVQILSLASKDYWLANFPAKVGINWGDVKDYLIRRCQAVGTFDGSRVRGTGVWLDKGRVVVNSGHSLLVDGSEISPLLLKSWHVYKQTANKFKTPDNNPLNLQESNEFLKLCNTFNWEDEYSGYFLAGWLAIARIAGALPVRPHLWLTGPSGSGKSTIMERLINKALGDPSGRVFALGASTEAGIRQTMSICSIPLICDEFETNDKTSADRIKSIIHLLRQAWSASEGYLLKGSAGGFASRFSVGFSALVSSIRTNIDNDADESRFTFCGLKQNDRDQDRWREIDSLLDNYDHDFGDRLFARSIANIKTIIASYKIFYKAVTKLHNNRTAQQYGMLLAGAYSLISDDVVSMELAEDMVSETVKRTNAEENPDHIDCLNYLTTQLIRIQDFEATNLQISYRVAIQRAMKGAMDIREALSQHGIIFDDHFFYTSNSNQELKNLFSGSKWPNFNNSLSRIPGAIRARKYFNKVQDRCVGVPLSYIGMEK